MTCCLAGIEPQARGRPVQEVHGEHDGHVEVHLKFPMLMPGSMRQKVQEDIDKKLTGLFGWTALFG